MQNVIVNSEQAQAAQYGYGVNGAWTAKVENLVISRERRHLSANRLPCIGLNPTRSSYFGSDGMQKGQKQFLSIVPRTDLHYISLASSNVFFFSTLFVTSLFSQASALTPEAISMKPT